MNKKLLAVFGLLASFTMFTACGVGGGNTGSDTGPDSGSEVCTEHTGGTATCTQKAECSVCLKNTVILRHTLLPY